MTYTETAIQKHGVMFYAFWRHGWDHRQAGIEPIIPRHYSHYAELAYKDGYKQGGDIVKANWNALGIAV